MKTEIKDDMLKMNATFEEGFAEKFEDFCNKNGWWASLFEDYNDICFLSPFYLRIKLPKKKTITVEWVKEQIEKHDQKTYENLSKYLNQELFDRRTIYPTSYGIGVDAIFGYREKASETVAKWLDENGIEYTNEFSDAHWVYRFKISKSKENIERLKRITGNK